MVDDKNDKQVDKQETDDKPGWKKGLWFVGLWLGGVLVLGTIGFLIRLVLG
ncbi:DUF2474 domain-containing protein [Kangiella marina]|uniref:DUF2474 domain-containing protein n=1 Tax=Kangiella marina TaxID=1079178 RepID=A0ABP8IDZ2_9GAMM